MSALQLLETTDLLTNRLEVGEHSTEPTLRYVVGSTLFGLLRNNPPELLLRADEQDALARQNHFPHRLLSSDQTI